MADTSFAPQSLDEQTAETERVVRDYFAAISRAEADAAPRFYAPSGHGRIQGVLDASSPQEMAAYFASIYDAIPDWRFEVLDVVPHRGQAAVRWRIRGTFAGPGEFQGLRPNGAAIDVEGMDLVWVADGQIQRIEAYTDNMTIARQLGALPPDGSAAQQRMTRALNAGTRVKRRIASEPEQIADGVWVVRGGFPMKTMNVYLVRDGDGVLVFDAGIKAMTGAVRAAGASLGGITRVVLGHSHADHRGVAPHLGVPVLCHPAERADAEGDGGAHYFDFSRLEVPARWLLPLALRLWDGGPVKIAGTLEEGDDVAGFEVVHLPGHAPGLIGLWRASDRLALVSDCFYTLDPQTGRKGAPRMPHVAFNLDTEQARASMRKLAALEPSAVWTGHADPLTGDVREQIERAAGTT